MGATMAARKHLAAHLMFQALLEAFKVGVAGDQQIRVAAAVSPTLVILFSPKQDASNALVNFEACLPGLSIHRDKIRTFTKH
jgi:hypothetical protein